MVTAFPLREITIDNRDITQRRGDFRHDDAALGFLTVVRETATNGDRRRFGQQRHAIVPFLPIIKDVVTEFRHLFEREHVVVDFRLLQANHVGLMLLDNRFQLMGTGTQAVDIKRDKFHSRRQIAVGMWQGC